jgi:hypothetical protein
VSAEDVALISECAECEIPWLPDETRWQACLTDDEPPELAFFCSEALSGSSVSPKSSHAAPLGMQPMPLPLSTGDVGDVQTEDR